MKQYYHDYAIHLTSGGMEFIEAYSVAWDTGGLAFYGHDDEGLKGVFLLRVYGPGTWIKLVCLDEVNEK